MPSVDKKFPKISLISQRCCHQENSRQQVEEMVNMLGIMKEEMGGGSMTSALAESWKMLFPKVKKSTEMLIAGFLYVADLENMVQYRRNEHGRRRKIKRNIIDIPKKGVAGLRLDCDANTVNLARESSADGADSVPAQSGASVQSSSVRPLTSVDGQLTNPATPSPDASASLEDSFAHLQLGGDSIAERSHRGEGEEEHESPSSGRVPAPDTSIEETESDASSDSEDVSALVAKHSLTQQRLLVPNPNQTASDRSGTDRSVAAGGTVSVRSRRPDGQCTVTEV